MSIPQFDHEKLEVYQLSLKFTSWLNELLAEIRNSNPQGLSEVNSQVDRASISISLNVAEGNGRRASQQRARFFDDARGSATEAAACLDILVAKNVLDEKRIFDGKVYLVRIVAMLSKLVDRFDSNSTRLKEEEDNYNHKAEEASRTRDE